MIRLTRLRHSDPLYVNPDHIERLDRNHDTVVHLLNGNEYVVVESPKEIVGLIPGIAPAPSRPAARMAVDRSPTSLSIEPIQAVAVGDATAPRSSQEEES